MKHRAVILGAGFGGLSAAQHLSRHLRNGDAMDIVLLDKHHLHTYTPLLYEVVSGGLKHDISTPDLSKGAAMTLGIAGALEDHPSIRMRQEEVADIRLTSKEIVCRS